MTCNEYNDGVEITDILDFDPRKTFECGQCFRWDSDASGAYTGVAFGRVARVHSEGSSIFISCSIDDFENVWRGYFDLDRDYASIRQSFSIDVFMREACDFGAGIRILKQDAWEALCSFIISQCNNIPRIKKIIGELCRRFGDRIEFQSKEYFSFPSVQTLSTLETEDLSPLRCGYRAPYIISAAKAVEHGDIDLSALSNIPPNDARKALTSLRGVGTKVADCAMLYGLNMLDSFPLDVWMKRAVAEHFGPGFDHMIFHPYAGIAQQYIYYYERSKKTLHSLP